MGAFNRERLAELARSKFAESAAAAGSFIEQNADVVGRLAEELARRFAAGGKLLLFGNGGSAADAQHIAAEFVNRLSLEHPALPAIALTTDTSVLTSIANDRSFAEVFSRQIEALGNAGDVAWGISTSGMSENVLKALAAARQKGLLTIFLAGQGGADAPVEVDFLPIVPHTYSPRIQEVQITFAHVVCELVEAIMFGKKDD